MRISDCSSDVCSSDLPLQGVSKYNYTVGLLYEKYGISGRLVYTYRSKYFDADASGQPTVRPVTPEDIMAKEVPPLITYQRPAGRLDFNVGYDVSEAIRIDVGGTNILRHNSSTYYDRSEEHTSELQSLMPILYAVLPLTQKT